MTHRIKIQYIILSNQGFLRAYWVQVPEVQARGTDFEELIEKFKSAVIEYLSDNPFMDTFLRGRVLSANSPMPYKGEILQEKIHPLEIEDPCATDKFPTPFLQEQERKISRQQKNPREESEIVFLERILKSADRWWLDVVRKACPVAHLVNQRTMEQDFYNRLYLLYSSEITRCGNNEKPLRDTLIMEADLRCLEKMRKAAACVKDQQKKLREKLSGSEDNIEAAIKSLSSAKIANQINVAIWHLETDLEGMRNRHARNKQWFDDRLLLVNNLIWAVWQDCGSTKNRRKVGYTRTAQIVSTLTGKKVTADKVRDVLRIRKDNQLKLIV